MAFPTVRSSTNTDDSSGTGTNVTINLPATIRQNDVIFVLYRCAVAGAIGWPDASWNELFDASSDPADDQMAAAWKRATGTEGGTTIVLTKGSGGKGGANAWAIAGSADPVIRPPELSTVATGTSANPNATTCTPTGGAKDYLWLTFQGREGEATSPPTFPTNYTVSQVNATSGTAGAVTTNVRVNGGVRTNLNAASEDAGQWTFSDSEDWTAYTIAFHPTPDDPIPGVVRAFPPRVVLRTAVAASVGFAFPFLPGYADGNAAELTEPPRVVLQRPVIRSEIARPIFIEEPPPPAATAIATVTGNQVSPPPTVQYTPIAGPMTGGDPLAWRTAPPGLVPLRVVIRSELVQPQQVSTPLPDRPLSFNDDGLIRPDPWMQYTPVAGPVGIPVEAGWWPQAGRVVPVRERVREALYAKPPFPVDPAGRSDLPWLMPPLPPVLAKPIIRSASAAPVTLVVDVSNLPWLMRGLPLVLPQYPVRSMLALPVSATAGDLSTLPWLRPNLANVLPVYPVRPSTVLVPAVPATQIDLPWITLNLPLVRAQYPTRSIQALPVSATDGARSDLPWLMPSLPLVRRTPQTQQTVVLVPAVPTTQIDLPWLSLNLPRIRAQYPVRAQLVLPVSATAGALSNLPWLLQGLPMVRRTLLTRNMVAAPLVVEVPVVPTRPLTFSDDGMIRPDRYFHYTPIAGSFVVNVAVGWATTPPRVVRQLRTVQSLKAEILTVPGQPPPNMPWLPPTPLPVRRRPQISSVVAAPPFATTGTLSELPWILRGLPLVLPRYPVRPVIVLPPPATAGTLSDLPWLLRGLPAVLPRYPTRSVLVMPVAGTSEALSDLPWILRGVPPSRTEVRVQSLYARPVEPPPTATGIPWMPLIGSPVIRPRPVTPGYGGTFLVDRGLGWLVPSWWQPRRIVFQPSVWVPPWSILVVVGDQWCVQLTYEIGLTPRLVEEVGIAAGFINEMGLSPSLAAEENC
jgi:hypothetical protein